MEVKGSDIQGADCGDSLQMVQEGRTRRIAVNLKGS